MARKPEATFKNAVHKHLDCYYAGMGGSFVAGILDTYYEAQNSMLWVEWKFYQVLPPVIDFTKSSAKSKPKLSKLQQQWLLRAHANNVPVAVICGCKEGGVIFQGDTWKSPISRDEFKQRLISRKEIAEWVSHYLKTNQLLSQQ